MPRIERKYMAHYLDAAKPSAVPGTPSYVRLGKDLEEYSPEMSAEVEKSINICGFGYLAGRRMRMTGMLVRSISSWHIRRVQHTA